MTPEAITQLLTSLDINPDKIKDEKYAEIIRVLLRAYPKSGYLL